MLFVFAESSYDDCYDDEESVGGLIGGIAVSIVFILIGLCCCGGCGLCLYFFCKVSPACGE